ncbi:MAG: SDR family NAD(P)-dependent oxidoreductase [Candidatus Schekmanbacteria bacterium]|nr:SDR family NAD(P)-dependent oxidoreductase [Candidatus Schekmanbacteria bacterium]
MRIDGKGAIVAGGASGLGEATVRCLVDAGARVIVADLNEAAGEPLAAVLGGDRARFVKTNVCDPAAVAAAISAARELAGGVHILVNCAGIAVASKILGKESVHDLDAFRRVLEVNLVGTFNTLRLAAEAMSNNEADAEGERGVVISTASVAAFDGQIGQAAYAASKGGIAALALPAARELSRFGIRVVTIAPGIFDTPMLAGLPEKARQSLGEQVPFPSRLGRPSEYAALARAIIENPMLNGEVIRLDGALRMAAR